MIIQLKIIIPTTIQKKQKHKKYNISELKEIFLNKDKSLFERYRAMFTLRDIGR